MRTVTDMNKRSFMDLILNTILVILKVQTNHHQNLPVPLKGRWILHKTQKLWWTIDFTRLCTTLNIQRIWPSNMTCNSKAVFHCRGVRDWILLHEFCFVLLVAYKAIQKYKTHTKQYLWIVNTDSDIWTWFSLSTLRYAWTMTPFIWHIGILVLLHLSTIMYISQRLFCGIRKGHKTL